MLWLLIRSTLRQASVAQLDECPTRDQVVADLTLLGWQHSLPLLIQEVSGERMCTILINCLED